jgi:hypothetical protein
MIQLSRTQDEEVGDGTTSVIILAGELLQVCLLGGGVLRGGGGWGHHLCALARELDECEARCVGDRGWMEGGG